MKHLKKILMFVLILISFQTVLGDLTTDLGHYWNVSSTNDDQLGIANFTDISGPVYSGAVIDDGFKSDGNDGKQTTGDVHVFQGTHTNFSFGAWINLTGNSGTDNIMNLARANFYSEVEYDGTNFNCKFAEGGGSWITATMTGLSEDVWHYMVCQINGTHVILYMDNVFQDSTPYTGVYGSGAGEINWGCDNSQTNCIEGMIDEIGMWKRTITPNEISLLYNSGVGCNPLGNPLGCGPGPASVNTSLIVEPIPLPEVTFSTNTYFIADVVEFNISGTFNGSYVSAMNIEKLSVPGSSNDVYGRIKIDGVTITDELLRSVSTTGDIGSTGFEPKLIELGTGGHNISFEFRRTGLGNIRIFNRDFIGLTGESNESLSIRNKEYETDTTYSNTVTQEIDRYRVGNFENDEAIRFLFGKYILTTDNAGGSTNEFVYTDIQNDKNGTFVYRELSGTSDTGAFGYLWNDRTDENVSFNAKTDAGTTTVNGSIVMFQFNDTNNNIIKSFNKSNPNTDELNSITLTSGIRHYVVNKTFLFESGQTMTLGATVSLDSSATTNVNIVLNSTNNSLDCDTTKTRYFDGAETGNIYLFSICNNTLNVGSGYEFNLMIEPVSNNVDLLDEVLIGFQSTPLPLVPLAELLEMDVFTDLVNNTINYNNNSLPISYNFSVGSFNTIDTANCTLFVDGVLNQSQTLRNDSTNYLFNFTYGGVENNYTFEIRCSNEEINSSSGIYFYRIDTLDPIIQSSFTNNSNIDQLTSVRFYVNFTDTNLFAYNISLFDVNGVELENYFATNLTVSFAENDTTRTASNLGNFSFRAVAWDSHTTKEISDYKIDKLLNGIEFEDQIQIYSSDIKKIDETKKIDRYSFQIEFETKDYEKVIYIESDKGLIYLKDSYYPMHFVDLSNNKWIDFKTQNVDSYNVVKINNKKYQITIYSTSDVIYFDSIGDLNSATSVWYYTVVTPTTAPINLTGVENAITDGFLNLTGGVILIGLIFFIILFFILGVWIKQPLYWSFSGGGLILIALSFAQQIFNGQDTVFNFGSAIFFSFFGLMIMFLSVFLFLRHRLQQKSKKSNLIDYNI